MEIKSNRKGNYHSFKLFGDLDTQGCFDFKKIIFEIIEHHELNICLDLAGLASIDSSGVRFISNIHKALNKTKRHLAVYNCSPLVAEKLSESSGDNSLDLYENQYAFENTFAQALQDTRTKYFGVSMGSGPIRRLSLKCPLCNTEGIIGYMCDESQHELKWEEEHITPQWRLVKDKENELDFELYEVAVCHNCLFASARLEHFEVVLPEGKIESTLLPDEKERLTKKISGRSNLINQQQKSNVKSFFSLPREKAGGFVAWQLYDKTVRDISRDKAGIQYIEVCRANILSAKFSTSEAQRNNSLTSSHVWLTNMIDHPENQTTTDLVHAYVYLISVNFALEKTKLAKKLASEFLKKFSKERHFKSWVERVNTLLT